MRRQKVRRLVVSRGQMDDSPPIVWKIIRAQEQVCKQCYRFVGPTLTIKIFILFFDYVFDPWECLDSIWRVIFIQILTPNVFRDPFSIRYMRISVPAHALMLFDLLVYAWWVCRVLKLLSCDSAGNSTSIGGREVEWTILHPFREHIPADVSAPK